jgi:hypothetical protein
VHPAFSHIQYHYPTSIGGWMKRSPVTVFFEKPLLKDKGMWFGLPVAFLFTYQAITNIQAKGYLFIISIYWLIFIGYVSILLWKGRRFIMLSTKNVEFHDRYFNPTFQFEWEDVKHIKFEAQDTIFHFKNGRPGARFHPPLELKYRS